MRLGAGRAPAALIEPFFGSNASDSATARDNMDDLAEAVILGAADFFDI